MLIESEEIKAYIWKKCYRDTSFSQIILDKIEELEKEAIENELEENEIRESYYEGLPI